MSFISKIAIVKYIDSVLGRIVTALLPSPARNVITRAPATLLIVRPGGIGDAVLLAPSLHFLKKQFSGIQVTILAESRNAGVFPLIPGIDRILCYDRPRDLLHALRSNYDAVIDSEQWHRLSAVVARFVSAPVKIGFDTNERRRMFTHPVPYSHDDYETNSFARLMEPFGLLANGMDTENPFLFIPDDAAGNVTALLEPLKNRQFVTIFPGASVPERQWGADRFRRVAEALSAVGIMTVVVGGKVDRRQGDEIVAGGAGLNLAGQTSLPETAAILQKSELLLSGDSGVLHIAVGLGVATVSLFGPGRPEKWAPQGMKHIVLNKRLTCSPCTTFGTIPSCPDNARCMRDITVDEVFNAVCMLLTSTAAIQSRRCCKRDWIETA